jgi:AbiV family abortive infection protein
LTISAFSSKVRAIQARLARFDRQKCLPIQRAFIRFAFYIVGKNIINNSSISDNYLILDNVTVKEAANGIVKLIKNSEDLLDSAEILIEAKRIERAVVLIIAALEESEKVYALTTELYEKRTVEEKNVFSKFFWKKWRHHGRKQLGALVFLNDNFLQTLSSFDSKGIDELTKKTQVDQKFLETARKLGLYVDFDGKIFKSPLESFQENKYIRSNWKKLLSRVRSTVESQKHLYSIYPEDCMSRLKTMYAFLNSKKST